jgi:exopolyphosphatase/guanosine-5'-triphosphate,3'-diphosphate pyrophosphatase
VARTNGRAIAPLVDTSEGLQLGSDLDGNEGSISTDKTEELLATLVRFQQQAADAEVSDLHLMATHAIRLAKNRNDLCDAITHATGLGVQVLSPEQEAALSFLGADADCPSVGPQAVVDIGGGSMQIGVGQNGKIWDSVSLQLGAARVVGSFLPSDPPTYVEEALLVSYLVNVIPPALPLPDTNLTGVIGVGGTLRRTPPLLDMTTGEQLPQEAIEKLLAMLRGRASTDIAASFQMKPERARLLMPALLVVREVLRGYDYPPFIISAYGIREGAILSLARHGEI